MSENDKVVRPIIIKKKIIKAAGHHGGAWKVAYADFVTAMMAFFLLMWLLNATSEDQRQGIAAYFNPGIPVFSQTGGGSGMFGGETVFSEETKINSNGGAVGERSEDRSGNAGSTGVADAGEDAADAANAGDAEFTEIENMFRGNSGESWVEDPILRHVATRITDEGLIIDIFDLPDSPLFEEGTNQPSEKMFLLLAMVSRVIGAVTNEIAISGHVDKIPEPGATLDGFALTGGRALVTNAIMIEEGIDPARFNRLTGGSDRTPVGEGAPEYRNRRIEIVLLRKDR